MGAWDTGIFDNDGAGDCLIAIQHNPASIQEQVQYIQNTWLEEKYMEVDEGSSILALGELVLIAYGIQPTHPLTADIDLEAIKSQLTQEILSQITQLIRVALNVDNTGASEIYELWAEADTADFAAWKHTGNNVLAKLEQINL
ncbi:DUF4259 domain-containing protein [Paenibacillus sp. ACRRX]|uniref:DUF4259 domain-containing protein n=1 Tax=Paenibacillus sp. ACRRX TaxID=2918206 RepID=UPI001EF4A4D7|nr:DUF4259 domain-containing protein [Paenibacillus sp. ACRRX]MCG7410518.1 DUF4259 domain-containing protein [Paenibacillus sp. ACRRX]